MSEKYQTIFITHVNEYVDKLDSNERAKIMSAVGRMVSGDFQSVVIKKLRDEIRELKVKRHRLIFFIKNQEIYFVGVFVKKTTKTPKREVDNALKKYQKIIKLL
jgi:phage-related protein